MIRIRVTIRVRIRIRVRVRDRIMITHRIRVRDTLELGIIKLELGLQSGHICIYRIKVSDTIRVRVTNQI